MCAQFNKEAAAQFWDKRVKETDPLSAVLTFDAPAKLNEIYDLWERQSLMALLDGKLAGKRVLDVGCGIGRISLALAEQKAQVTAVDLSKEMLKKAQNVAKQKGLLSAIDFINASSDKIECDDSSFDLVVCFGLLEHLPAAVRTKTMREIFRLMKKSGRVYLIVNNVENVFLKPKYKLKSQRADGYFVTLVGLDWLEKICLKHGKKIKVMASNPMYGLAHYSWYPAREALFESEKAFNQACDLALKSDLLGSVDDITAGRLASHFLVEIKG